MLNSGDISLKSGIFKYQWGYVAKNVQSKLQTRDSNAGTQYIIKDYFLKNKGLCK